MSGDYRCVIDKGLNVIEQVLQSTALPLKEPIRYDLGAELMASTKAYPHRWAELAAYVRQKLEESTLLKENVTLGHNFSHHVQYLMEIEQHPEYFSRVVSGGNFVDYPHLLFVDDMTQTQGSVQQIS